MDTETVACPDCDLLQQIPALNPGDKARCPRCGRVLATAAIDPHHPLDLPLSLTLTAFIVLIIANTTPLMGLSVMGKTASTTIVGGAYEMWINGEPLTAAVVAFSAVIAPGLFILFMLIVLLAARRPPAPHWVGEMLRWALSMQPWSMLEVMMLGILVALIKIAELATVEPGIAMFAVGALMLLFPAIISSFNAHEVWARVEWDHDAAASQSPPQTQDAP
ncbi:MAG: paraquat-inducible protein A [Halothiobacillaceae bacterium]|nr:paraquat-inducible protein A [Halothiobacillaceae bacterium]